MILGKENLEALLLAWPAPTPGSATSGDDEGRWEERAEAIVVKATAADPAERDATAALFDAPMLAAEPGEPAMLVGLTNASGGETKMSEEKESGGSPTTSETTAPPTAATVSTPPPERKRTSLKAMAERASQSGASRASSPSLTPGRSSQPTPLPSTVTPLPSRPATATSTPLPRPAEASKDDSGIINLNAVKEAATPAQVAAADKAKPGQADLFEEEKAGAEKPAAKASNVVPIAMAKAEPKKSNNGAIVGAVIAVLGVAAAFAITQRKPAETPPPVVADAKPTAAAEVKAAPTAVAPAAPTVAAEAVPTADPSAAPDKGPAKVALGGPLPTAAAAPTSTAAAGSPDDKSGSAPKGAVATGKPGDLQSEMIKAAGGADKGGDKGGTPEPAAGGLKNQNVPEQPSQGSVQSAIGAVNGAAKSCVAGADDVSRAQVTFGSSGAVTNVSVTGWAAAHGKSGCVQAALKGAKVGPFSKPSFTVGTTIRP